MAAGRGAPDLSEPTKNPPLRRATLPRPRRRAALAPAPLGSSTPRKFSPQTLDPPPIKSQQLPSPSPSSTPPSAAFFTKLGADLAGGDRACRRPVGAAALDHPGNPPMSFQAPKISFSRPPSPSILVAFFRNSNQIMNEASRDLAADGSGECVISHCNEPRVVDSEPAAGDDSNMAKFIAEDARMEINIDLPVESDGMEMDMSIDTLEVCNKKDKSDDCNEAISAREEGSEWFP